MNSLCTKQPLNKAWPPLYNGQIIVPKVFVRGSTVLLSMIPYTSHGCFFVCTAGELIVDRGSEVVSDTAPGSFTQLNIYSGLLYLGGVLSILELALTWPGQVVRC